MSWWERLGSLAVGDITSVICTTTRDAGGITYEVLVSLRSLARSAYEQGEDQMSLWVDAVHFSKTPAARAGGAAFVEMAREQQRIADEVCRVARLT